MALYSIWSQLSIHSRDPTAPYQYSNWYRKLHISIVTWICASLTALVTCLNCDVDLPHSPSPITSQQIAYEFNSHRCGRVIDCRCYGGAHVIVISVYAIGDWRRVPADIGGAWIGTVKGQSGRCGAVYHHEESVVGPWVNFVHFGLDGQGIVRNKICIGPGQRTWVCTISSQYAVSFLMRIIPPKILSGPQVENRTAGTIDPPTAHEVKSMVVNCWVWNSCDTM